jgi:hypothetical protein
MLNKQVNDPDVAGVGRFVEENCYNLGLADLPVKALNRAGRHQPDFRDEGRKEITGRSRDAFKFRVLTLRQLKDARFFFHNGSFTTVKDVVQYFNAGVPQDAEAAAAGTLTPRFTRPRGPGSPRGLGLTDDQVEDLTDFIENGLYDPAFVHYDPASPTPLFQLSPPDFLYSIYRPDLVAAGATDGRPAVDGRPLSGLAQDNDDALSRRDMGLEFLDVTNHVTATLIAAGSGNADGNGALRGADGAREKEGHERRGGEERRVYRIANTGTAPVDTHLLVIARGLPAQVEMTNASGRTSTGDPYLRVFLPDGILTPGQSIDVTLRFRRHRQASVSPTLRLLSGQGNP